MSFDNRNNFRKSNHIPLKTVLISGSSRGLGRSPAEAFLEKEYCVAVNYLHSQKEAEEITTAAGKCAVAIQADVGRAADVAAMISRIETSFGRIDILINNAGITRDNLLIRQTEAEWDAIIRTNLTGCFNLIRAAAPLMIRSGGGNIINISSCSGAKGNAGQAAYSASKADFIGLTISAADELAEHNIRVNAVMPGYMPTGMGASAMSAMKQAKEESVLNTLSEPSAVARSIAAIAGTGYITGQIVRPDCQS